MDAMDVLPTKIPIRVDERLPLAGHRAVSIGVNNPDFDHAVMAAGKQSGRLEVDHGKALSNLGDALPL